MNCPVSASISKAPSVLLFGLVMGRSTEHRVDELITYFLHSCSNLARIIIVHQGIPIPSGLALRELLSFSFLVASTRFYNPLCRSVGLSVGRLVGWSVGRSRHGLVQRRSYNVRLTTERGWRRRKKRNKRPFEIRVRERLGCKKKKVIAARR